MQKMTSFRIRGLAAAAALLLAAACDSSTGSGVQAPARLDVVAGDQQTGTAGAELASPLVVKVVDEDGKVVKGQLVNFRVVAGGGTVFAGSAQTNKDGIAQERWTLGTSTADSQKVEARAVDPETGQGLVFATFRATATASAATAITLVAPAAKSGFAGAVVADSPAVKATDKYGNPAPGVTVTWTADAGSTISPTTQTNAAGIAKAAWTLSTRVDSSYRATATSGALGSAQFTATAALPAGSLLQKLTADQTNLLVGTQFAPLVARLTLADGRPIQGADVLFTSSVPNAAPVTVRTAADGTATFAWTPDVRSPDDRVWTASVAGASVSFVTRRLAGPVTTLAGLHQFDFSFTSPPVVGAVLSSTYGVVRAFDPYGNFVPNAVVTWTVTSGNGSVNPAQSVTDAFGRTAGAVITLGTVANGFNEFTATSATGVFRQTASPVTGAAATLTLSPDTVRVAVGETASLLAQGFDAYGNVIVPNSTRFTFWDFASADEAVATVSNLIRTDPGAPVTGVAPGTTIVTGTLQHRGGTATATVVVVVQ